MSSIHLNTCKYYVCGIKFETKVMCLHKIRVEKISLFHIKKSAVNDFWLLPVMFQVSLVHFLAITCNVSSLTCALRRIISAYCINHSLDKHSF